MLNHAIGRLSKQEEAPMLGGKCIVPEMIRPVGMEFIVLPVFGQPRETLAIMLKN